jgi:hypothetical protein
MFGGFWQRISSVGNYKEEYMNTRRFFRWLGGKPFIVGSILAFFIGAVAWLVNKFVAKTLLDLNRILISSLLVALVFALVELWEYIHKKDVEK